MTEEIEQLLKNLLQIVQVPLTVVAAVSDHFRSFETVLVGTLPMERSPHPFHRWLQQPVFLRLAARLGMNHHLVLGIYPTNTNVALYHTMARLHLGAFVIRNIALNRLATRSQLLVILGKEIPYLAARLPQGLQLALFPLTDIP
ncbi:MAG: hypothetical protein ACE5JR_13785 [Gemmatimonadota bacterium]